MEQETLCPAAVAHGSPSVSGSHSLARLAHLLAAVLLLHCCPASLPVVEADVAVHWRAGGRCRRGRGAALVHVVAAPCLLAPRPSRLPVGIAGSAVKWQGRCGWHRGPGCRASPATVRATPDPLRNRPSGHQAVITIQVVGVAVEGGRCRGRWRRWRRLCGRRRRRCASSAPMRAAPGPLANRPPVHEAVITVSVIGIAVVRKRRRCRRLRGWRLCGLRRWRRSGCAALAIVAAAPLLLHWTPGLPGVAVEGQACRRREHWCWRGCRRLDLDLRDARAATVACIDEGHQEVDQGRDEQQRKQADAALTALPAVVGRGHFLVKAAAAIAHIVVVLAG
mmetsp:Transcript_66564/g.150257  ORF Transcript_66564/g.150257 Transcript_66564/m.150257 type:complete len:336 (+) Transcript_66564:117-1124(+)